METMTRLTADQFAEHPAARGHSELVRGELRVMTPAYGEHGLLVGNVFRLLSVHCHEHRLGRCFTEDTGYRLPIPGERYDTVRAPDASFVRADRVPAGPALRAFLPLAPDVAVEVLSASDTATVLAEKLDDYLAAGTRVVWVVDPERRAVEVRAPDAPVRRLRAGDALDGAPVLPDFRCTVAELFDGLDPADAAG